MMTRFWKEVWERGIKTFLQFYLGTWMLTAGLLDTDLTVSNNSTFDLLFTLDNVKAGIVGLALSIATSIGSTTIGDKRSPSVV